jgi:16S rRNA (cytosine967-C5)-methyltransferase
VSALAAALRDAAPMVERVAAGMSLAAEFERRAEGGSETPRAALIDLTHGTLRRYGRVQAIVRQLSRRASGDALVEALLWCSLYALESGRYAEYTVVDQAVRACGLLERWNAKGYVNAVLRGFLRERGSLEARIQADVEARYQHPRWWIEIVRAAYPADAEAVLAAGNSHPPMCLRVNRRRASVAPYQERLLATGIGSRTLGNEALLLERPVPVERLPGFDSGEVSVQDAAACGPLSGCGRRPARSRCLRGPRRQERSFARVRAARAHGTRCRRRTLRSVGA